MAGKNSNNNEPNAELELIPLGSGDFEADISQLPEGSFRVTYIEWLTERQQAVMPSDSFTFLDKIPIEIQKRFAVLRLEDGDRFKVVWVGKTVEATVGMSIIGRSVTDLPHIARPLARFRWCVQSMRPYFTVGMSSWSYSNFLQYSALGLPFGDGNKVDEIALLFGID